MVFAKEEICENQKYTVHFARLEESVAIESNEIKHEVLVNRYFECTSGIN